MVDCSLGTGSPNLVNDVEKKDASLILWLPFSVWPVAGSRNIRGSGTVKIAGALTSTYENSRALKNSPKEVKHDRGGLRENSHQYVNNIT